MKHCKLRIAWSVGWGAVALLLCRWWADEYRYDLAFPPSAFTVEPAGYDVFRPERNPPNIQPKFTPLFEVKGTFDYGIGGIPYWVLISTFALASTAPWLRHISLRFSLRTLLIATTLVAVVLGLVVWMSRAQ